MLLVLRALAQELVRDLRIELRLPAAKHLVQARRRVGIGWVAPGHLDRAVANARVHVRERLALDPASLVHHVHRTPVRNSGDRQLRDLDQQLIGV